MAAPARQPTRRTLAKLASASGPVEQASWSEDQELAFVLYGRVADSSFAQDRSEFSDEEQAALSWVYSHERPAFDWMASKARDLVQQYCKFTATAPIPREAQKAILATMIIFCETLISVKQQLQELSKQADTRLQLWSERWRVDQNYYQPLSSAGATQLADALCVAVANAGHPQLVAEVAIRNEFFLKQISQLALTHQLKRQQSMQAYRARLHAAEQELIQCTQEVLAISRHREPVELSLAANTDGVGLGAKLPQRTPVEVAAEDIGAHILIRRQADLQEIVRAQPLQTRLLGDILNSDILNRNPSLFLAYNHSSEVMEMYEIRTTPNDGAGLMLQVGHASVSKSNIPRYLNTRVQKFQSVDATLEYLPDDPDAGWTLSRSRRPKYRPVQFLNNAMQQELSKVLDDKLNIKGGCWKTLLHGELPNCKISNGFQTAKIPFAIAGLCRWFGTDARKAAAWQVFKSAKLENGQLLTLATCGVDQYATSSSPTHRSKSALIRSRFTNRNVDIRKITLYASCNSPFWEKELMWG